MKTRIVSGLTILSFIAAVIVFNHSFPIALNIVIALVSVLCMYEIITALGLSKKLILLIPSLAMSALVPFVETQTQQGALYFAYTVVLFSTMILCHEFVTFREVGVIYSMTLLIPTALETIIRLRHLGGYHGMFYVMIAIFSAWIADTGAYFAGSFFGKHKLCPQISPNKTIEGVIGGFVLNIIAMMLFGYLFHAIWYAYSVEISYITLLLIGIGSTIMSILGDLSFSLIKRSCHIKDFGQAIPGHGGILDRFDSVIFVAPFVFYLVKFMPIVIK
ncbi:MAG TPA: CDP-archaeol synthase [Oscillospiraceae bacterium]|nr:CDP-archaeol synthase [Oscillospiraceae bacterium]